MTDRSDNGSGEGDPDPEDVYGAMDPLEPYTTGEVARLLDIPRTLARELLTALGEAGKIRVKRPDERPIWIREPPAHTCRSCGREFEVKYLHAVLSSVQFCPRCGTELG